MEKMKTAFYLTGGTALSRCYLHRIWGTAREGEKPYDWYEWFTEVGQLNSIEDAFEQNT